MKERALLRDLIERWTEYLEEDPDPSIERFSSWIAKRKHEKEVKETYTSEDELALKMELGYYLGRIINFTEVWGKLAFKDLPIKQFEDFGILSEVKRKGNPSKMEVANILINEKSTAIERIKRLVNQELLKESIDQNDKRIRRIALTKKGEEVLSKAYDQAMKVSQLITWPIPMNETAILLDQFKELNSFHTNIYENKQYKSIDDLL